MRSSPWELLVSAAGFVPELLVSTHWTRTQVEPAVLPGSMAVSGFPVLLICSSACLPCPPPASLPFLSLFPFFFLKILPASSILSSGSLHVEGVEGLFLGLHEILWHGSTDPRETHGSLL